MLTAVKKVEEERTTLLKWQRPVVPNYKKPAYFFAPRGALSLRNVLRVKLAVLLHNWLGLDQQHKRRPRASDTWSRIKQRERERESLTYCALNMEVVCIVVYGGGGGLPTESIRDVAA